MTARKFYKTTFTIEVLSEELFPDCGLEVLAHEITYGDCSGVMSLTKVETLDGKQAADALNEQASDPGFFQLTEDGNDIDIEEA